MGSEREERLWGFSGTEARGGSEGRVKREEMEVMGGRRKKGEGRQRRGEIRERTGRTRRDRRCTDGSDGRVKRVDWRNKKSEQGLQS